MQKIREISPLVAQFLQGFSHLSVYRKGLLALVSSFVLISLVGCASPANASLSTKAPMLKEQANSPASRANSRTNKPTNKPNDGAVHSQSVHKILSTYRQWAGTRYRLGGTTKAGIDCSAFVKTTMHSAFQIDLPRSTAEQKYSGKAIAKSELRPGDLVFFRHNHHVGVYIGDGKFVHASSSRGVITSSLSERYWAKTYTQSRRVL